MIDPRVQLATEEVFAAFARFFASRWRPTFEDPLARPAWAAGFIAARLSPAAIRRGLAKAATLKFPPSLGEFIELCEPPMPTLAEALASAGSWARGTLARWPHPAVGDAAHQLGSFKLRHLNAADLERAFDAAYRKAIARHRLGESLTVPATQFIAPPKRAPKQQTETGRRALAELGRVLGVQP